MIINQTKRAVEFYKLAIKNSCDVLEFQVNQDEKYQDFKEKYRKKCLSTIYYSDYFSFAVFNTENSKEKYFSIEDGEIIYDTKIDAVEDMAKELLAIVGKFYE